jgi:murein L,D-transpeptidase YafK
MSKTILIFAGLLVFSIPSVSARAEIPSSARSRTAIRQVEPRIKAELEKKGLKYGSPVFMRIFKVEKELEVWVKSGVGFGLFKTYKVCTWGGGTLGPKTKKGDGQAPEGFYFVTPGRMNPYSSYHLSFNLGYPNEYDRAHGRTGGALMVHGECVSIGCYAMTNAGIDEIYAAADAAFRGGQKYFRVHIFPFRMTQDNITAHAGNKWDEFWRNLREGYDFFENFHIPPNVEVRDRLYVFEPDESGHELNN